MFPDIQDRMQVDVVNSPEEKVTENEMNEIRKILNFENEYFTLKHENIERKF